MKKILLPLALILSLSKGFSQNIGINATGATPHSSAMLDVSSTTKGMLIPRMTSAQRVAIALPATGLMVYDTDNTSFWVYKGAVLGWVQVNYWANTGFNSTDVYNTNSGNVGIGTTTPFTKLNVKTLTNSYGVTQTDGTVTVGTYIGASEGWIGTRSNHPLTFFTNDGGQAMTLATNGFFGIGNNSPANRLQIGDAPFGNYDLAIGSKTNAAEGMAFLMTSTASEWHATRDILIKGGSLTGVPHVGINTSSAANTLQIGSLGSTGFNGNDLAFGNGTNATGFFQANSYLQVASSTNIALMPGINNGAGRVGINTTVPRAPLEVDDNVGVPIPNQYAQWAYYTLGFNNFNPVDAEGGASGGTVPNVSIIASNRILASEFDAYSDVRIKNIVGISNSQKDLQTINSIRITDYTMKDKVKYGSKPFKKVIAQEVEKVYPQVVSTHTDFIPNVYQLTTKVERTKAGYLLIFSKKHNITKDARKLRILSKESKVMEEVEIKTIPSDYQVLINGNISDNQLFVFGEEVNDFRTVDYEGLTTLNISATQELSKLMGEQNKKIEALENEINSLRKRESTSLPASYNYKPINPSKL
jgi:hypothetical protein